MCEKEVSLERGTNSLRFHLTFCPFSFPGTCLASGQFFLASLPSAPQNHTEAGVILFAFCRVAISTELNHVARGRREPPNIQEVNFKGSEAPETCRNHKAPS